jgi:hypothetical protein
LLNFPAMLNRSLALTTTSRLALGAVLLSAATWGTAEAAVIELFPADAGGSCTEEFETVANGLRPGDELVLHGGTYAQVCRRAITVIGTSAQPITIRAAAGEIPVLTNSASQNNLDIVGSSYLVLRGLHFQGGSQGIRFEGTNHHITLEQLDVANTENNAVALNSGNSDFMTIRRNHIHHTGVAAGSTEGEGLYLGCHTGSCRVTNSLIEGNYIHHLRGSSSGGNDGIEVKAGSYGNVIRHNVIHDTTVGTQYPCILVYGGGAGVNTVESNVMWNCGEGIYAVADAVIRNNVILSSAAGISSYPHAAVGQMKNLTIVHNTIVGRQDCLFLRWTAVTAVTLANNAVYCGAGVAVDGTGLGGAQVTVRSNYTEGVLSGASLDGTRFVGGGTAAAAFVDPLNKDVWPKPGSTLIGKAAAGFVPPLDFNDRPRGSPYDIGAYETDGLASNPGWTIAPGFKPTGPSDAQPPSAPTNLRIL